MEKTIAGIDNLLRKPPALPGKGRVGVLCNASTVTSDWVPTADALTSVPGLNLVRIFSPQHGFTAEKQDNMIESDNTIHPTLGTPIVSLYSQKREPSSEDLDGLDALIIDLQDVGTRVYTFLVTALFTMEAAAARGLHVILLDRPNPIGSAIEGPVLEERFHSFVGAVDVPLRHGLTAAEFCLYGAWRCDLIGEDEAARLADAAGTGTANDDWLKILPLTGWRRSHYFDQTGLPWTMPSPNMPTPDTAIVFPGQVALEGTNLSEGRGTTRPFELFGAPYLLPEELHKQIVEEAGETVLDGVALREVGFEPTFQKHAADYVRGFQIHVTDRNLYRPVILTTSIISTIYKIYPDAFAWREPPYEYEHDRLPIDLIYGTDNVRLGIEAGVAPNEIAAGWSDAIKDYRRRIDRLLIYRD